MKRSDAQIFILSHKKEDFVIDNDLFTPIEVGAYYNDIPQYNLRDNLNEDNISKLNPIYLEQTGVYYIYKHLADNYKYIGLNQHRRQFDVSEDADFDELFSQYKIILHKEDLPASIIMQYYMAHNIDDLDLVLKIILEKDNSYSDIINQLNYINFLFTNASYITTSDVFKDYCSFYFDVMSKFLKEKNIYNIEDAIKYGKEISEDPDKVILNDDFKKLTTSDIYQARLCGYL